jgi:hypothetical protein
LVVGPVSCEAVSVVESSLPSSVGDVADFLPFAGFACWMSDVPVEWIAQAGVNLFIDGNRLKLISKCVVPFGGGNVNGIRSIAGGLGIAAMDNNASFITQLQVMF